MPANFKTYEAQSRLLAAVLAAHPELKLNFKVIAKHYGKDTSESGIEHRFRPLKKAAQVFRAAVKEDYDPAELPIIGMNERDIAKFFGESTKDGIQFQFRSIKADAEALKQAVQKGQNAATALSNKAGKAGGVMTPTTTPRKRGTPGSGKTTGGASSKRARTIKKELCYSDDDDDEEPDYEARDLTPTKPRKSKAIKPEPREESLSEPTQAVNAMPQGAAAPTYDSSAPGLSSFGATPSDDGFQTAVTPVAQTAMAPTNAFPPTAADFDKSTYFPANDAQGWNDADFDDHMVAEERFETEYDEFVSFGEKQDGEV